jgi:hypothetical protein
VLWRTRAFRFAQAVSDKMIKRKEEALCSQDKETEFPFSLQDGMAGEVCLLVDLLNDEKDVRQPGYEI